MTRRKSDIVPWCDPVSQSERRGGSDSVGAMGEGIASKEGRIRTALVKRGADKKRGRRLVDLRSLEKWIEKGVGL